MSKFFNAQDLNDINIVYDDFSAAQVPVYLNNQNSLSLESTPPKKARTKRAKSSKAPKSKDAPEVEIVPKRRAKSAAKAAPKPVVVEEPEKPRAVKSAKARKTATASAGPRDEQAEKPVAAAAAPVKVRKVVKKTAAKPPKLPPPKHSSTPNPQAQQDISDIEKSEHRGRSPSVLGDRFPVFPGKTGQEAVPQEPAQIIEQTQVQLQAQSQLQVQQAIATLQQENERRQQELINGATMLVNGAVEDLRREIGELVQNASNAAKAARPATSGLAQQPAHQTAQQSRASFLQMDASLNAEYQPQQAPQPAKPSDQSIFGQSQLNELRYSAREAQLKTQQAELRMEQFMAKIENKIDTLARSQLGAASAGQKQREEGGSASTGAAVESRSRSESTQTTIRELMQQMQREQETYMRQCQLLQQQQLLEAQQQMAREREKQQNDVMQQLAAVQGCLRDVEVAKERQIAEARHCEEKYSTLVSSFSQTRAGSRPDVPEQLKWLFAAL